MFSCTVQLVVFLTHGSPYLFAFGVQHVKVYKNRIYHLTLGLYFSLLIGWNVIRFYVIWFSDV